MNATISSDNCSPIIAGFPMQFVGPLILEPFSTSFTGLRSAHMRSADMPPGIGGLGEADPALSATRSTVWEEMQEVRIVRLTCTPSFKKNSSNTRRVDVLM